jgi:putative tricarboxylic transport membrane protein
VSATTDTTQDGPVQDGPSEGTGSRSWWTGRAGLVFPAILAAVATYLLIGQLTMEVAPDSDLPGPRFFPGIVIALLYLFAVLQAVSLLRTPEPPGDLHGDLRTMEITVVEDARPWRWYSDWSRLAWAIGGFAAFILLLEPMGWILSAGLLFWSMTRAFVAPHPKRDVLVALAFSSLLYLVFAGLLSVNLPAGAIFGGGN